MTAIILAAGASRRMGHPKASLAFSAEETFLEHLLAVYGAIGCDAIVVVGPDGRLACGSSDASHRCNEAPENTPDRFGRVPELPPGTAQTGASHPGGLHSVASRPRVTVRLAINTEPGADRLSSIRCGLALVPHGTSVFLQDVDRPFVTAATLRSLVSAARAGGYSAPDLGGRGGHPLLLSPAVVEALRAAGRPSRSPIDGRPATLREALLPFRRTLVAVDDVRCDLNINTPADYRRHLTEEAHDVA